MKRVRRASLDLDDDTPRHSLADTLTSRAVAAGFPVPADTLTAQVVLREENFKTLNRLLFEQAREEMDINSIEQDALDNPEWTPKM